MNSVRNRILLFFTLFAVLACWGVYTNMQGIYSLADDAQSVVGQHLPTVFALGEMNVALERQENAVQRYVATGDKVWLDVCERERSSYNKWFVVARDQASEATEQERLDKIDELYIQYDNQVRYALLSRSRGNGSAEKILTKSDVYLAEIQTLVDQIKSVREGMTVVHQRKIQQTLEQHKRRSFVFLLGIIALFFVLAMYLWYYLVRPLTLLLDGIRNFTRGKTDIVIPPIGKDELGELQEAFNEMSRELTLERKRLKAESQSDSLTGLFNMRYFKRQVVDEFSRSHRYGRHMTILMIDVDHFKSYNDRNGHPAGDIVLKEIARILIRNVRGTDIVARYGGEEFVILLPETALESAIHVAEKIRSTVQEHHFPFKDTQSSERLTVSVGVAAYPDLRVSSDQDLVEASDKALYLAKKNGRNQVCVFHKGETISGVDYQRTLKPAAPVK